MSDNSDIERCSIDDIEGDDCDATQKNFVWYITTHSETEIVI